jgi:hypothetical protein
VRLAPMPNTVANTGDSSQSARRKVFMFETTMASALHR